MKKLAVVFVLIAGTLWGIIGLFVRNLQSSGLTSMHIVCIRMVLSALMFSIFIFFYDRKLFKIKLKDIWCFLGTGILSVATFSFCYFKAIELSSLSQASILLYTAPIFVMLFSMMFFKEKLSVMKAVSIVLAFLGCVFVTGVSSGGSLNLVAVLYGLMSGVCYALYSIFSRFALDRKYSPLTITLYTFVFSGVISLFLVDIKPVYELMTSSMYDFFYCFIFALLSSVLPYLTYTLALKYIKSSTASIIASVEPVVATVTGALFFSEMVQFPTGYIGIALVIASIMLINMENKKI